MITRFIKVFIIVSIVAPLIRCLDQIKEIAEHIKNYETAEAQDKLYNLFTKSKNFTSNHIAELLNQYGNLIYFGQHQSNNSLKMAFYYFKLAAYYGSSDALFMTSLFSNFRLDGSYNILQNLDILLEQKYNQNKTQNDHYSHKILGNLTETDLLSIYQYVSEKKNSASVLDLYLSSQQKSFFSQLALAHKYMHQYLFIQFQAQIIILQLSFKFYFILFYINFLKLNLIKSFKPQIQGNGVNIDCRTAVLYLKDLGSDEFLKQEIVPNMNKIVRLDLQIYNLQKNIFSFNLNYDQIKLLENFKQFGLNFKKQNLEDLFNLANSYFYGVNGLRRNFNKSFELFKSIYQEQDQTRSINHKQNSISLQAGSMIGYHYLKGFGVKQDYKTAFQYFSMLANHTEGVALNGLGFLYYHGLGVEQNQRTALTYFKKAANIKDLNGLYNYGIIHMMPSTDQVLRDRQVAHQYLNMAAEKGHYLAQYALGLLYLDGVDFYQSCELSSLLMSRSMSRSISTHFQNSANYQFTVDNFRQAHLNYLISGYLGEDTSLQNAAIIADKQQQIYTDQDIDFQNLQNELEQDQIYNLLKQQNQISIDLHELLFEDIIQLVKNKTTLNQLLEIKHGQKRNSISGYLSYSLLRQTIGISGYSNLRLGDYFYYGTNVKQDYKKAYLHYKVAAEIKDQNMQEQATFIQAQGYFNLAYMEQLGQGVPKDYKLAYQHFNQSLSINSNNLLANVLIRLNFLEDILQIHERDVQIKILKAIKNYIISFYQQNSFILKAITCLPFILFTIYLIGKRLRIKNVNNI